MRSLSVFWTSHDQKVLHLTNSCYYVGLVEARGRLIMEFDLRFFDSTIQSNPSYSYVYSLRKVFIQPSKIFAYKHASAGSRSKLETDREGLASSSMY
jgi:hypothetical protein